ncbi:hypothetical protein K2F43_03785 [Clostridium estertheticum]|uniref:phosphorylase family protein n=1 Tax=Clostridium estertheticum TaxID=238834 RepID=UPI001C6EA714|nr:hypothetical protein [Clostridium estertheticum]WLC77282.1 hypothetical protein KTC99_00025 [Clostridium estertheticum]
MLAYTQILICRVNIIYIYHICYVNNIPFIVIRSMSDNADKNALETFESNIEMAALNSTKLVEKLIKKLGETEHSNKFDTKA